MHPLRPLGRHALRVRELLYLGRPQDPYGFALRVRQLLYLGRPQDRSGSPVDATCSTWGDPKTLRVRQLLYLGRPQDRTRNTRSGSSTWGDPKTALAHHLLHLGRPQDRTRDTRTRLTRCSTWGDPKTALAPQDRTDSPIHLQDLRTDSIYSVLVRYHSEHTLPLALMRKS